MNRVLIIAAHPDDDILGCGGILSKYRNSTVQFKVVFIGEGTSCRYLKEEHGTSVVKKEMIKRNDFGVKALNLLGVDQHAFYNLPCGRLDSVPILEINKIIEKEIK